jgi:phosphoadenosine phosphosulfate reductase
MNEQLCMIGFGVSLEDKIEKAIGNFREYEREALRRDPVNGYYLCNSYGKDSGVILDLAKRSGVRFAAHHNLTTIDPPELIWHGRRHHPETIEHRPDVPLLQCLARKKGQGPPTRLSRWCCEEYKEKGGKGMVKVIGVRAAESARRAAQWRLWTPSREKEGYVLAPIIYWTDDDVWTYTRQRKLAYCCLYDEGFDRLGCIGCPMARKGRGVEFDRWPKYEQMWQRAFRDFWARWHGVPRKRIRWVSMEGKWPLRPIAGEREERRHVDSRDKMENGFWTMRRWYDLRGFQTWQDLWQWWMEELPPPDENDCQMGMF